MARAFTFHCSATAMPSIYKRSRVARIVKHLNSTAMGQFNPEQVAFMEAMSGSTGKEQPLLAEGLHRPQRRSNAMERFKEVPQALLNLLVHVEYGQYVMEIARSVRDQ